MADEDTVPTATTIAAAAITRIVVEIVVVVRMAFMLVMVSSGLFATLIGLGSVAAAIEATCVRAVE